jgi:hypothetical protein
MDTTAPTSTDVVAEADATAALTTVSDQMLDAAVEHLRELAHVALVEFAIAAGRYVVEAFFDGNIGQFFDRSSSKASSFNALCSRRADELAAIGLSQSTLRRYVHAYDTWRHLPEEARASLSLRTLELLRKVPDQVSRTELMLSAQREGWSAGTLAQQVTAKAEALAPPPSNRGRPRLDPGEKELRALVRQIQVVSKGREAIAALPAEKLAALRAELRAALAEVEGVLGGA